MIVDIRDLRLRAQEYFSKYAAGTRTLRLWALLKYFPKWKSGRMSKLGRYK